jgi:hypothetical protein
MTGFFMSTFFTSLSKVRCLLSFYQTPLKMIAEKDWRLQRQEKQTECAVIQSPKKTLLFRAAQTDLLPCSPIATYEILNIGGSTVLSVSAPLPREHHSALLTTASQARQRSTKS